MSGATAITVIGNLTADPVLRSTGSGTAFACFTIASTPRTLDPRTGQWADGKTVFLPARHGAAPPNTSPRP